LVYNITSEIGIKIKKQAQLRGSKRATSVAKTACRTFTASHRESCCRGDAFLGIGVMNKEVSVFRWLEFSGVVFFSEPNHNWYQTIASGS